MASQGPNSPGTAANDSSIGTIAWSNVSNSLSSNNSYSTVVSVGTGESLSNYLKVTNFGFSIPSDATIDGIIVEVERKGSMNAAQQFTIDKSIKIVKGGTISGNEKADTVTEWPTTDTYVTYGNSSDLWGLSWSYSDINSSTFGVAISCDMERQFKTAQTSSVDHVRITVYYTTGGGGTLSTPTLFIGD